MPRCPMQRTFLKRWTHFRKTKGDLVPDITVVPDVPHTPDIQDVGAGSFG